MWLIHLIACFFCFSVTLMLALNALWAALKNCSNNTVCSVHVPLRRIEVSLLSLDSLCHPGRVRYSVFSLTLYISINTLEILFFSRWKMHSNGVFHNSYACTELYSHALHLSGSVWLMWAAVQGIKEVCLTKPTVTKVVLQRFQREQLHCFQSWIIDGCLQLIQCRIWDGLIVLLTFS